MQSLYAVVEAIDTGCLLTRSLDHGMVAGGYVLWDAAMESVQDRAAEVFHALVLRWSESPVECLVIDHEINLGPSIERWTQRLGSQRNPLARQVMTGFLTYFESWRDHPLAAKQVIWRLPLPPSESSMSRRIAVAQERARRWSAYLSDSTWVAGDVMPRTDIEHLLFILSDPYRRWSNPATNGTVPRFSLLRSREKE